MSGSQKFSRNFRRKVLSNFLRMSNVCQGMSSDSKNLFGFLVGQILRACAYYNIARLSTTWKFYASDRTAGHGPNELNLLRNVKRLQKLIFFLLDKFSCSLIRSVEFPSVDNRAMLRYAQARRICPLKIPN